MHLYHRESSTRRAAAAPLGRSDRSHTKPEALGCDLHPTVLRCCTVLRPSLTAASLPFCRTLSL